MGDRGEGVEIEVEDDGKHDSGGAHNKEDFVAKNRDLGGRKKAVDGIIHSFEKMKY